MSGYPSFSTLVVGVPFSGKPLPWQQVLTYNNFSSNVPMNYNCRYYHVVGKPIDEARNFFAEQAVECGAKYLFQWDEDVMVQPYIMRQLIFWLEHHDDWGMVGGVYCQKNEPSETCAAPMVFRGTGKGPFWKWHAGELFEVDSMGTGASLIRVEVFKDVEKPWFKTHHDVSPMLDNIPGAVLFTEDIWFCDRLKKTGKWKIFADGSLICKHLDFVTGKEYGLPPLSYPMQRLTTMKGEKKILDIGAGENKYQTDEGVVVSVDIRKETNPDFQADVRQLPFASGSFDIVFSSHVLEHFPRGEVGTVLDEWLRLVAPDGEIRLVIPNIGWAAEKIVKGEIDNNVLNVLYGAQDYGENFHKMGFTPGTLEGILKARGFSTIETSIDGYNILIKAKRQNGMGGRIKPNRRAISKAR